MPARLAFFDLDNTLIDRAGAFRIWACAFSSEYELGPSELEWLELLDGDGLTPRLEFFSCLRSRYALQEPVEQLVAAYRHDRISRGREWFVDGYQPDAIARSVAEAVTHILSESNPRASEPLTQ